MLNVGNDRRHETLTGAMTTAEQAAANNATTIDSNSTAGFLIGTYGVALTTKEVAEVLHCHPSHVRALCALGEIPATRIGQRWIVPASQLAATLER